ncbi:MAG: hypothetical protein D6820_17350, partial [Lentisphaerae bacterium]
MVRMKDNGDPQKKKVVSAVEEERTRYPVFFLLSLLLHLLVIGSMTVFVVRQRIIDREQRARERVLAEERVEKVAEQIRDINITELRQNVLAILGIKHEMDSMINTDGKEYLAFVHQQIKRKPDEVLAELQQSLTIFQQAHQQLPAIKAKRAAIIQGVLQKDPEARSDEARKE